MSIAVDKINELQAKVIRGEDPSAEEILEAIKALRAERGLANKAHTEKVKTSKAAAEELDLMALFGGKKNE